MITVLFDHKGRQWAEVRDPEFPQRVRMEGHLVRLQTAKMRNGSRVTILELE